MSESKFIKWQDRDNDGLIDVCEDTIVDVQESCSACKPDPSASIPNWKDLTIDEPFLNGQNCTYQITVKTSLTTTGAPEGSSDQEHTDALTATYELYATDAIKSLLAVYEKENSAETRDFASKGLYASNFDLAPYPGSRLKLQYSIPTIVLDSIAARTDASDDEEEEETENTGGGSVTYNTTEIYNKVMTVRKSLWLYNNYLKIYRFVENGNLFFVDSNRLFELGNYGDSGFGDSLMADILPQLESFLNTKDFKIPGIGWPGFQNVVEKLSFAFDGENKLTKLEVFTAGCGDNARVFEGTRLRSLNSKSSFKDPTAMGYFMNMDKMEQDLKARVPKYWLDFILEYTSPAVYSPIESTSTLPGQVESRYETSHTIASCVKDALISEGKELGQDLLDETFGIADAIMYKFHRNLCYKDSEKLDEELQKLGLFEYADPNNPDTEEFRENLFAVAQARAYESLEKNGDGSICAIFSSRDSNKPEGTSADTLDDMYNKLDRIKACGLSSMLMSAIQCLFKGMTLEQALSKVTLAALEAMDPTDLSSLFILLPPDKQAQIEQLVRERLASGDLFSDNGASQQFSDVMAGKEDAYITDSSQPEEFGEGDTFQTPVLATDDVSLAVATENLSAEASGRGQSQRQVRTLAQQFSLSGQLSGGFGNKSVVGAYVHAIIEVYQDNYLALIDYLNKFPGADIIAKVIATLDCPVPPVLGAEGGLEIIKEEDLPSCLNLDGLALPELKNPFGWLPKRHDLLAALQAAAIEAINEAILRMIQNVLLRVCKTLSSAACKTVEIATDVAQATFTEATFGDLLQETICGGDEASSSDQAVIDVLGALGPGAVALADEQQALSFSHDLSMSTTRAELSEATLGNPSDTLLEIVLNLVQYEYPDYAAAFNNKQSIAAFFKNVGSLMPMAARKQLRDHLDTLPEDDQVPANPCACATPEQFEDFCNRRTAILEGRASQVQISHMCEVEDELGPLAQALQSGPFSDIPLMGSPGCDDGLLPFEPKEAVAVSTAVLDTHLKQIKADFTQDMLGSGPFFESDWGLLNMVLSDTLGNPLSTHNRKKKFDIGRKQYVDYYVESPGWIWNTYDDASDQKGGYPVKVAERLQEQMAGSAIVYNSNNEIAPETTFTRSFDSLNIGQGRNIFDTDINLTELPDFGYDIDIEVDWPNEAIKLIKSARKKNPDVVLKYYNHLEGYGSLMDQNSFVDWAASPENRWNFAFDLEVYTAEMTDSDVQVSARARLGPFGRVFESGLSGTRNRPGDITRIKLVEYNKVTDESAAANAQYNETESGGTETEAGDTLPPNMITDDSAISETVAFEFAASDDSFKGVNLLKYPKLVGAFTHESAYAPQVVLLHEMMEKNGQEISIDDVKSFYDKSTSEMYNSLLQTVSDDKNSAWKYGAEWDNITSADLEYVLDESTGSPKSYYDSDYKEEDGVLGISGYQWQMKYNGRPGPNRVYYLPPAKFGGSYMSPPIYIAPVQNKGWLGFLDVLFPEPSSCKPSKQELVDFVDIQENMSKTYPSIPEDERLRGNTDCALELPYNRIMERPAISGMEALITATIRIYATTHFIKTLATFATIKPDFDQNYSNIFAAYVVEDMEYSLKDAQTAFWEFFTLFKDEEFWFAFLEQSVQAYSRRIDSDETTEPPPAVLAAFERINDYQANYKYPTQKDLDNAPDGETGWTTSLSSYREEKNFEAIRDTEEDAKIILAEMVKEQLNIIGESLVNNFDIIGVEPEINDLALYMIEQFADGGIDLNVDQKEIVEQMPSFPTEGGGHYTNGGEFVTENAEDYQGYYHVMMDANNKITYMEGEYHSDGAYGFLSPMADRMVVEIGDIQDYDFTASGIKPFVIEKYTSINGEKYSTRRAMEIIKTNVSTLNVSDVYPGTLDLVTDNSGEVVGLQGELGVRHGLQFSVFMSGKKYPVAATEVDMLDTTIENAQSLDGDTKLLLCLLRQLKSEEEFKLLYQYIYGVPKMASTIAVYNDVAFLNAIGEKMVTLDDATAGNSNMEFKPGHYVGIDENGNPILLEGKEGWDPRSLKAGEWLSVEWRKWDKVLLRNSKARIKRTFKTYYYSSRKFDFSFDLGFDFGWSWTKNLRSKLSFPMGAQMLPWWKKAKLRSNPFDANGKMCEKK